MFFGHADFDTANIMDAAQKETGALGGMRILRAEHGERGWRLKYITLGDEYPIAAIERRLTRAVGEAVRMVDLHYDFDIAARMIYA